MIHPIFRSAFPLIVTTLGATAHAQPEPTLLPGSAYEMIGMSGNAATIIGTRFENWRDRGAAWSLSPTIQQLNLGMTTTNRLRQVSDDGGTIVGNESEPAARPFRWRSPGPRQFLPVPATLSHAVAYGVSPDGSTIVGAAANREGRTPLVWSGNNDPVTLPLPQGTGYAFASVVAGDGAIYGVAIGNHARIVRWIDGVPTELHAFPASPTHFDSTYVYAVSADGSTIVGTFAADTQTGYAWRWTAETGLQAIPNLPGTNWGMAYDVSGDGKIVVGKMDLFIFQAFIWTPEAGTQPLEAALSARGVDMKGWGFSSAAGISDDATLISGHGGRNGSGGICIVPLPPCRADFNGGGAVTSQDFFDFLAAFFAGDTAADFDQNGAINSSDFFAFLLAFFTGCA